MPGLTSLVGLLYGQVESNIANAIDTALTPIQVHHKRDLDSIKKHLVANEGAIEEIRSEVASIHPSLTPEATRSMVKKTVTDAELRITAIVESMVEHLVQPGINK